MGGYSLLIESLIRKNNLEVLKQIDDDRYDRSKLIELKLHLPLPYNVNCAEYKRMDGQVEKDGVVYNYVMRKIWNDTLYVLCLPNTGAMQLNAVKNEYAQKNSETPFGHNKNTFAKRETVNAIPDKLTIDLIPLVISDADRKIFHHFDSPLHAVHLKMLDQPPDFYICA